MAIRFVPKTAEDLKAEAETRPPAVVREATSESAPAAKPARAGKAKRKPDAAAEAASSED